MNKNFYLYAMFLVLFITAAYCIFSFSNVDLLGGFRSSDIDIGDGFSPIVEGNYEHKGTKSNPLSLYEDNDIIYREMLKSIHNGERDFYLDVENRSSSEIKKRLEEIKSFYLTANQAIYPTLIGVCSYRYEYLSGGSFVLFTLSDIGESGNGVKNGYKDYQKLCKYVKDDIRDLYDNGTLKKNMSDKELSMAVSKYIAQNAQYDSKVAVALRGPFTTGSTGGSRVHNPLGFYEGWDLVCDGYAALYNIFMWELGIESYIVTSANHAWNLAYLDGKWYHSDVTYSDPVTYDRGGNIGATLVFRDEYINLTYTQLKNIDSDHTLTKESKSFVNTFIGLNY